MSSDIRLHGQYTVLIFFVQLTGYIFSCLVTISKSADMFINTSGSVKLTFFSILLPFRIQVLNFWRDTDKLSLGRNKRINVYTDWRFPAWICKITLARCISNMFYMGACIFDPASDWECLHWKEIHVQCTQKIHQRVVKLSGLGLLSLAEKSGDLADLFCLVPTGS